MSLNLNMGTRCLLGHFPGTLVDDFFFVRSIDQSFYSSIFLTTMQFKALRINPRKCWYFSHQALSQSQFGNYLKPDKWICPHSLGLPESKKHQMNEPSTEPDRSTRSRQKVIRRLEQIMEAWGFRTIEDILGFQRCPCDQCNRQPEGQSWRIFLTQDVERASWKLHSIKPVSTPDTRYSWYPPRLHLSHRLHLIGGSLRNAGAAMSWLHPPFRSDPNMQSVLFVMHLSFPLWSDQLFSEAIKDQTRAALQGKWPVRERRESEDIKNPLLSIRSENYPLAVQHVEVYLTQGGGGQILPVPS